MSIYHENILERAFKIIPRSKFEYRLFIKTRINDYGQCEPEYTDWADGHGIVQPGIISSFGGKNVSEKDYKELGLDFSRCTVSVWIKDVNLRTLKGSRTPDQIRWQGREFNIIHVSDWLGYDGWKHCYAVEDITEDPDMDDGSSS